MLTVARGLGLGLVLLLHLLDGAVIIDEHEGLFIVRVAIALGSGVART